MYAYGTILTPCKEGERHFHDHIVKNVLTTHSTYSSGLKVYKKCSNNFPLYTVKYRISKPLLGILLIDSKNIQNISYY